MVDHPADMVVCFVSQEQGQDVAQLMIAGGDLATPGRGSVLIEHGIIRRAHDLCAPSVLHTADSPSIDDGINLQSELTGICCIVQRGEGNDVARIALDTGTCVPAVTFGHGTGVRDKLGLLRIAIPAEKEIVHLAASSYDADIIMNMIIDEAKLDQPGKGFIYLFPLEAGQIDMKVFRGMPKHAASVEQIITAVDEMKGGSQWRARAGTAHIGEGTVRTFLRDLVSLSFICDEGRGDELVRTAMDAGAPGATTGRMSYMGREQAKPGGISPAREKCSMIVHLSQVDAIIDAMIEDGAIDDRTHGIFFTSPVPRAYTFIGRR
jgi:nitrogen regulatory protein PII